MTRRAGVLCSLLAGSAVLFAALFFTCPEARQKFDEKGFMASGLRRLDFPNSPISADWFRFVMRNRRERNPEHGYDLVSGPVANDRVYTVIAAYEAGFVSEEDAIVRLKPYRLADQYLFHTPESLVFLKAMTTVEVQR